jgi:hypothetical protein
MLDSKDLLAYANDIKTTTTTTTNE